MLPAPPRNALRGVEGGAAVGVIYFVNIFGPQGPHSRPPWLVSRPRLSARESIISSGYGPFKVFPQLSLSFSCSSGEATPSRLAMHPPWPPASPPGASQGLSPVHPQSPGIAHLSPLAHSGPEASSSLPEQAKARGAAQPPSRFLSPRVFSTPSQTKSLGRYLKPGIFPRAPAPGLGGDLQGGIPAFCVSPLKLPKEV